MLGLGAVLSLVLTMLAPGDGSDAASSPASTFVELAGQARGSFANRRYEEAIERYSRLLTSGPQRYRAEAGLRIGLAHQQLGRCDRALTFYRQVQQRTAQWGIVVCSIVTEDYEAAFEALETLDERYPLAGPMCGNAIWEWRYRSALHRGLLLEHLGQYRLAVEYYVQASIHEGGDGTAAVRLADLYGATGRLESLHALGHSHNLEKAVGMRALELAGDLEPLARGLLGAGRSSWNKHGRKRAWVATYAAMLLARHADAALPLLEREAGRVGDHEFVYYALGSLATEEASAVLKEILLDASRRARHSLEVLSLNYALTVAGAPGRATLDELSRTNPDAIPFRSHPLFSYGPWFLDDGVDSPDLPGEDVGLPTSEELKEILRAARSSN